MSQEEIEFENLPLKELEEVAEFAYAGDYDVLIVEGIQDNNAIHGINVEEDKI